MKNFIYKRNPVVTKIFFAMLIPTILMNLTTALASFADTVIIGYFLDDLSLSVVTYATPIYMIINTFAALYAVGGSIAMGIDAGKGDKTAAGKMFSMSVELLVITGGILVLAGVLFGKQITTLLGAGPDVFNLVYEYTIIILLGAPIFMLNIGLAFFVRNDGHPTLSMAGMFLSIAVNIVSDVVFIGVFDWGVAGAAYATVLGQLVSVLVIAGHFLTKKNTLRFGFAFNKTACRIVQNGISTALHFIYQFVTILILNHLVVHISGAGGVVVYTVVFNLSTISLALFEGLSQTIQPMVSVFYGEKSNKNIKNTLRLALIATIVLCGSVTLILELAPRSVPVIFGISDGELIAQATTAVRIFSTSLIIMTINVILGYYLQSTEKNFMASVLVSLRCFALFLVIAFTFGKLFGLNGIWSTYVTVEVLSFFIFIVMNRSKRHRLKKSGTVVDAFLLDTSVEQNTKRFVCDCSQDNFADFGKTVQQAITGCETIGLAVLPDATAYLVQLRECAKSKKGMFIEVEIYTTDCKVIIRDNGNHAALSEHITEAVHHGSDAEYGPVLGWNRICLK